MVFFYFGPSSASWAIGNERFSMRENLPAPLEAVWAQLGELFQDKSMVGSQIDWMSTGPDGTYCIAKKDGTILSNRADLLDTIRAHSEASMFSFVEHVSLSPSGAWLITYNDGTVQLSSKGRFPDTFYALASPYLNFTAPAAYSPQYSSIKYVFFGAEDAVVIRTSSGMVWDRASGPLATALKSFSYPYTLGRNTMLCPWSNEHYFLEATELFSATLYSYSIPTTTTLTKTMIGQILSGNRPTVPSPQKTQPPKSQDDQHSSAPSPRPPTKPASNNDCILWTDIRCSCDNCGANIPPGAACYHCSICLNDDYDLCVRCVDAGYRCGHSLLRKTVQLIGAPQEPHNISDCVDLREGIRWTYGHVNCDGCGATILRGQYCYYCSSCKGGDFDLCERCIRNPDKKCGHRLEKLRLSVKGQGDASEPTATRWTLANVRCGICWKSMHVGEYCHYCDICDNGDFDLCQDCYAVPQNRCSHTLPLCKIALVSSDSTSKSSHPSSDRDTSNDTSSDGHDRKDNNNSKESDQVDKLSRKFQETMLKDSLMGSIVSKKPNVKWDDVAGLEAAKEELQEAVVFPLRFPQMFKGKRKPRRGILLYGPPGTGKSYLAKAVATEVDYTLFSISSSDVMSKWFGESEGLVRNLFKLAREKKPSVIFIDEIDALCGNRDGGPEGGNEHTARMKTEFLVQMDGVGNDNTGILVLAATNLPWSLDPAVRRRFQKRIHIPLPDQAARRALFRINVGDLAPGIRESEFEELARRTEGYSGSDISIVVQDALMVPVKKVHTATHFKKIPSNQSEWYTPCSPSDNGAIPMTWKKVPPKQLKEPKLTPVDFFSVLQNVKPSVGQEEIHRYHDWTKQFGSEGA